MTPEEELVRRQEAQYLETPYPPAYGGHRLRRVHNLSNLTPRRTAVRSLQAAWAPSPSPAPAERVQPMKSSSRCPGGRGGGLSVP